MAAEKTSGGNSAVGKTVSMVGVRPEELDFLRILVGLLRHDDPHVPELARQALLYLRDTAAVAGKKAIGAL
jgi:hypothetical protein